MNQEFRNNKYWGLILGGSSGLGLATATKLATHGMNVIILHRTRRSETKLLEMAVAVMESKGVQVLTYNMDATHAEKRKECCIAIASKIGDGRIRTLVHSIAKGNLKPMTGAENTLKNDDFHLTLEVMAISLYDWTRLLFEAQLFAEDARIISFTSEGNTKAWPNYAAVATAKVALEAITRSIALEFAPFGIRANCLQAGVVDTPSLQMIPGSEQLKQHSIARNPFQRLTTPQDVADAVYLLCKDEAAWITGAVIPVNGGEHLQ